MGIEESQAEDLQLDKRFKIVDDSKLEVEEELSVIEMELKDTEKLVTRYQNHPKSLKKNITNMTKDEEWIELEKQVYDAHNMARRTPEKLIPIVRKKLKYIQDNLIKHTKTESAYTEAIDFLEKQRPLRRLMQSIGLNYISTDHTNDIGKAGLKTHLGTKG